MLRSDTTALFERLREANILLQEVLSGAHENMSSLERTMVTRVSEFVTAMNDLSAKSDTTTQRGRAARRHFQRRDRQGAARARRTRRPVQRARPLARRGGGAAGEEQPPHRGVGRTIGTPTSRRWSRRWMRARTISRSGCSASPACWTNRSMPRQRGRERSPASSPKPATRACSTIEQQFELVRTTSEEERKRTGETLNTVYDQAATQVHAMFHQSADRFTEIMQGMKQMAAEMQQELETTRAELRRGIFELPQETADSAAQMRRVIVDQIEAWPSSIASSPVMAVRSTPPSRFVGRDGPSRSVASRSRLMPPLAHARRHGRRAAISPPRRRRPCAATSPARRRAAPRRPLAVAERRQRPQWRLAQRSLDPRIARRKPADCPAAPPRGRAREERRSARISALEYACGRRRPHDRPRRCRRNRGSATSAANAACSAGAFTRPRGRRRSRKSAASTAAIPNSGRPWSSTSTSSNGCWRTCRAATAARRWRATI